jgi:HAD superfamily hydrolase (TIGR01509 family)
MVHPIELIIFDSDGVLVDSELIANRVMAEAATAAGVPMDLHETMALFRGRDMAFCIEEIERRSGRVIGEGFAAEVRQATALAFDQELKAVEDVHEALDLIRQPYCVASNGPMEKLSHALGLTGLYPRFEGRIFSAYEVGHWKPDPGLFLHAAQALGTGPERCIVVEDSVTGVTAAKAAGMRVLGYAGEGPHAATALRNAGAKVFDHMRDLPGLLDRSI